MPQRHRKAGSSIHDRSFKNSFLEARRPTIHVVLPNPRGG